MSAAAYTIAAAALAAAGVAGRALFAPRSSLLCPVTWRGPSTRPRVALTFDDGPWPGATEPILDALGAAGARATFFVIGRYAAAHPGLLRRIHADGHQIGNHTYDHHRTGLFRAGAYWRDQITRADDLIERETGVRPACFRPPMGFKSPPLVRAAAGHRVIAWSRRARDGIRTTPDAIVRRLEAATPGEIILMHDGRDPVSRRDVGVSVAALPRVLAALSQLGLKCVRVDELLGGAEVAKWHSGGVAE